MEIKYFKSPATLLNRDQVNKRGLDLSKEVQWVFVGQRASEIPAIKVGGLKKKSAAWPTTHGWPRFNTSDNGINLKV